MHFAAITSSLLAFAATVIATPLEMPKLADPILSLCNGHSLTDCHKHQLPYGMCIVLSEKNVHSMTIPKYTQCQVWEAKTCDGKVRSAWANVPGMQKNKEIFDMRMWNGRIGSMRCLQSGGQKPCAYVS